jgi:hypothetical protein
VKRWRACRSPSRARGAVLAIVLILLAAGAALSSAVATSAALELAMADRTQSRLRAFEAAEAGLSAALLAREWSAAEPWSASGSVMAGGEWQAEVRLVAARIDPYGGEVEWHFEIESAGRDGAARVTLVQGFQVQGALPGEPGLTWWRRGEPAP